MILVIKGYEGNNENMKTCQITFGGRPHKILNRKSGVNGDKLLVV